MPTSEARFTYVDAWALDPLDTTQPKMPPLARLTLIGLMSFDWGGPERRKGQVWVSQGTLAKGLGLNRKTIGKQFNILEEMGAITIAERKLGERLQIRINHGEKLRTYKSAKKRKTSKGVTTTYSGGCPPDTQGPEYGTPTKHSNLIITNKSAELENSAIYDDDSWHINSYCPIDDDDDRENDFALPPPWPSLPRGSAQDSSKDLTTSYATSGDQDYEWPMASDEPAADKLGDLGRPENRIRDPADAHSSGFEAYDDRDSRTMRLPDEGPYSAPYDWVHDRILALGGSYFPEKTWEDLVSKYGLKDIVQATALLVARRVRNKEIRNPNGWIIRALGDGYTATPDDDRAFQNVNTMEKLYECLYPSRPSAAVALAESDEVDDDIPF